MGQTAGVQLGEGTQILPTCYMPKHFWSTHMAPSQWALGGPFCGCKIPEHEADHSPPSIARTLLIVFLGVHNGQIRGSGGFWVQEAVVA
jgi:hypothetical protein